MAVKHTTSWGGGQGAEVARIGSPQSPTSGGWKRYVKVKVETARIGSPQAPTSGGGWHEPRANARLAL